MVAKARRNEEGKEEEQGRERAPCLALYAPFIALDLKLRLGKFNSSIGLQSLGQLIE